MSNEGRAMLAQYFELGVSSTKEVLIQTMDEIEQTNPGITFTTEDIQKIVRAIEEKYPTDQEMADSGKITKRRLDS